MIAMRRAAAGEIGQILDWAAGEGWNPGVDDAAAFHAADPDGFFLATREDQPVAAISVVNHTPDFAFLGLYLCAADHRGQGIGFALWQHAIAHAGSRTIGLDGVAEQQANYRTSGFALAGSTTRYSGTLPEATSRSVRPATPADIPDLVAQEAIASGIRKDAYLSAWAAGSPTRQSFITEDAGRMAGFATFRACRSGYKIGPLVADTLEAAKDLLAHAAGLAGGAEVSIDVPWTSPELADLCAELGLVPGFITARMYRGPAPEPGPLHYAVTSLELG